MSSTIQLTNLRPTPFAHPEFAVLAPGATKSKLLKQVNADDYSANYPSLAAFGVAVVVDGLGVAGVSFQTKSASLALTEIAVVCDMTAPETLTLAASNSPVTDGAEVWIYLQSSTDPLTVAAALGDTVDGQADITLNVGEVAHLRLSGTNWAPA